MKKNSIAPVISDSFSQPIFTDAATGPRSQGTTWKFPLECDHYQGLCYYVAGVVAAEASAPKVYPRVALASASTVSGGGGKDLEGWRRTTLLQREQMQSLRHAPHRLVPPDRPGRRTSNAVFS